MKMDICLNCGEKLGEDEFFVHERCVDEYEASVFLIQHPRPYDCTKKGENEEA